jgi:excinuclease ABC subunit C
MLNRAREIRFEVTETELQALFRESVLIKQEQPKYNRALKSAAQAWYLKFDKAIEHPYMEVSREMEEGNSLFFGPFRSGALMRETMIYLHEALPLRKCKAVNPRCRPCIYFQMHTCAAPFLDEEHRRQHEDAIAHLFELLEGRTDLVIAWLEAKRDRLSGLLLFEQAAVVQTRLDALTHLLQRQTILEAAIQCRCLLIHQNGSDTRAARLLLVANGNVVSVRDIEGATEENVVAWVRAHFELLRAAPESQEEIDAADVLRRWLNLRREQVRWVAIRHEGADTDLRERVAYVLGRPAGIRPPDGKRR